MKSKKKNKKYPGGLVGMASKFAGMGKNLNTAMSSSDSVNSGFGKAGKYLGTAGEILGLASAIDGNEKTAQLASVTNNLGSIASTYGDASTKMKKDVSKAMSFRNGRMGKMYAKYGMRYTGGKGKSKKSC